MVDLALLNGTSEMVLKAAQRHCPDTPVVVTKVAEAEWDVLIHRVGPVTLQCGPFRVVSLISTEAARELGLEVGSVASAVVKATNVHVETPRGRS